MTFRGPADGPRLRALVEELEQGAVERVAFAVPSGSAWPLPAYELALMTARRLATTGAAHSEVVLVTPEPRPLHLFGRGASDAVGRLLSEAGVVFVGGVDPIGHTAGELVLADGAIPADRVVALPRLRGSRIDGVPQTPDGFIPVDDHCAVLGDDWLFAAGDITAFTIKQGGIATQQAVAAAEAIAVLAGATLVPRPFRPVLRGLLLTGGQPTYLRHDLAEAGDGDWASGAPIWWPPTKIVGRRLSPFLAEIAGESDGRGAALPRKTVSRSRSRSGGSRSIRSRWGSGSEENVGGGRRDHGRGGRSQRGARRFASRSTRRRCGERSCASSTCGRSRPSPRRASR